MRRLSRRLGLIGLCVGCALLTASCEQGVRNPETGAKLEGTVTYNNEQVQFALIIVTSQGSSATGKINADGKFVLTNVPLGEVKVAVNTDAGRGDFMTASMSKTYKGPEVKGGGGKRVGLKYLEVPKKYHDPETSGLKTTITVGSNTYDITIPK